MNVHEMRTWIRDFPYHQHIRTLPKQAGGHSYIPWQETYAMLDEITDGNWLFEIASAKAEGGFAVVHGRVTLVASDGVLVADEIGCVPLTNQAPPFEVATRSAVKRAASTLGLARNLWQGAMPGDGDDDPDHYSDNRIWRGDVDRPQQAQRAPDAASGIDYDEVARAMSARIAAKAEAPPAPADDLYARDIQPPQCKGCGVVVKLRNDGTPWDYCFTCNGKVKAGQPIGS